MYIKKVELLVAREGECYGGGGRIHSLPHDESIIIGIKMTKSFPHNMDELQAKWADWNKTPKTRLSGRE